MCRRVKIFAFFHPLLQDVWEIFVTCYCNSSIVSVAIDVSFPISRALFVYFYNSFILH